MRGQLTKLLIALSVIAAASLVLGSILGHPILLSYVETGSMEPTLDPGDGFVAVPPAIAGPVEEGDVIVFRAEQIQGGGLTTHRVVATTNRGYITKGDSNPFNDQESKGEPPVKDGQIVAKVLQVSGQVVVIPHLGDGLNSITFILQRGQRFLASALGVSAFLGTQGLAYLLFTASIIYYIVAELRQRTKRTRDASYSRDTGIDARFVVAVFTLLLVAGVTLPMVVPSGTHQYGLVSADSNYRGSNAIPAGQSVSIKQPLVNKGRFPLLVYLEPESEGIEVAPRRAFIPGGTSTNATVTAHAPEQPGYYRRFVTEHRYLAVLPKSSIATLYDIHPWAPILVIDLFFGVSFYVLGIFMLGSGRIRNVSRSTPISIHTYIQQKIRKLYE